MEKLKSVISRHGKDDELTTAEDNTGATGKITGEGSHFGTLPSVATDPTQAQQSSPMVSKGAAMTPHPSAAGDGEAAVAQSSTYSSQPLSAGDRTSSLVDPTSTNPTTFTRPETSTVGSTGVGPGAALTAAKTAYTPHDEMPGGFPTGENPNPYASTNLDPRVDSTGNAPVSSSTANSTAIGGAAVSSTATPSTLISTTDPIERSAEYGATSQSKGLDTTTPTKVSEDSPESSKKGIVGTVLGAFGLGVGTAAVAEHEHDKDSAVESSTAAAGSSTIPSRSGPPPAHHRKESIPTTAYPSGVIDSSRTAPLVPPQTQHRKESIPTTAYPSGAFNSSRTAPPPTAEATTGAAASAEQTSEHHLGRDAAVGGAGLAGLGAAAVGAHESTVHDSVTSQYAGNPYSSEKEGGTFVPGARGTAPDPLKERESEIRHDSSRMQAAGAGSGFGLATNEAQHQPHSPAQGSGSGAGLGVASDAPGSKMYGTQPHGSGDTSGIGTAVPYGTTKETEDTAREEESHTGRDAALAGAAGAGTATAAGYGAHEINKHDQAKMEKEQGKSQKAHEKEVAKEQKVAEKAEKKHEKEVAKEEKKQEKAMAKEEKKQEKSMAKEQKRQENESAAVVGTGATGGAAAYEAQKHHQPNTGSGGFAAADAADQAPYGKEQSYKTPASGPTVRQPQTMAEYDQQHYGRDAALGGAAVGTVGAGAYEAEKYHESSTPKVGGLAAADAADREAYEKQKRYTAGMADPGTDPTVRKPSITTGSGVAGSDGVHERRMSSEKEKKPGFFKRIFKRRKNKDTGESEDDEDNYEDVAHDDSGATTAGTTTTAGEDAHESGGLTKPTYNPFKSVDQSKTYAQDNTI